MLLLNDPHIQSLLPESWAGEEVTRCQGVAGKGSPLFGEDQVDSDIAQLVPILYGLAFAPDVRRILEIGVGPGFSTRAFFRGLTDSGGGQIVSVDIKDCSSALPQCGNGTSRHRLSRHTRQMNEVASRRLLASPALICCSSMDAIP